jgi:hypothetical protein
LADRVLPYEIARTLITRLPLSVIQDDTKLQSVIFEMGLIESGLKATDVQPMLTIFKEKMGAEYANRENAIRDELMRIAYHSNLIVPLKWTRRDPSVLSKNENLVWNSLIRKEIINNQWKPRDIITTTTKGLATVIFFYILNSALQKQQKWDGSIVK